MQANSSVDFQIAYHQLESLCQAIRSELHSDLQLWNTNVLPQAVILPQITAAEYCKVLSCLQGMTECMWQTCVDCSVPHARLLLESAVMVLAAVDDGPLPCFFAVQMQSRFLMSVSLLEVHSRVLQLLLGKLKRVLERTPPPEPSSAAINLMLGVGQFEVCTQ